MDDLIKPRYTPQQEKSLAEMARRAQDRCAIYNPTESDFTFMYNGFNWKIPAKNKNEGNGMGIAVYQRDHALTGMKKMIDAILTKQSDDAVKEENKRRVNNRQQEMDTWKEQPAFEARYSINRPELREPLIREIWKGIVEEYGKDMPVEGFTQRDERSIDEKLVSSLDSTRYNPSVVDSETPISNQATTTEDKSNLSSLPMHEVRTKAREAGIDVKLTDKKEDLLKQLGE
jgi:hypothetical protein